MKKVLALLLLIMISVAAFTHCCSVVSECTEEGTPLSQQDHQEGDDGRGCSPFFSCTTCPGFMSPATIIAVAVPAPVYPLYFEAELGSMPIPFYATPWQPPRNC
ncbi:MAG TPA: hypothetical protein VGB56_13310 [Flavisolibacter sp.]